MVDTMEQDPHRLARILKVLAVGTRVRIVQLLREQPLCVNALAVRLGVTPGAVSQHLRVMRAADLVIDERRGYYVHYHLNEATLARWRMAIDALLAPPDAGGCSCWTPDGNGAAFSQANDGDRGQGASGGCPGDAGSDASPAEAPVGAVEATGTGNAPPAPENEESMP